MFVNFIELFKGSALMLLIFSIVFLSLILLISALIFLLLFFFLPWVYFAFLFLISWSGNLDYLFETFPLLQCVYNVFLPHCYISCVPHILIYFIFILIPLNCLKIISIEVSSLVYGLFRTVLFSFQVSKIFPVLLMLLIYLISL